MRHFVAVAEELHFGKAAKRLNMAQPPVSQSIRRLELDLGVDLFNRSRRGVELTEAGRIFLIEARRTLMQAELARKMARRAATGSVEVRIAFIGPALYRVLPQLVVQFRKTHPDTHLRLFEQTSVEQTRGILAGDYDIGFVTAGTEYIEGCQTLVVERAPFVAALPASWPIAQNASVTLAMLADQALIMPPQRYAARGPDVVSAFKAQGLMPTISQEATQMNTALSLVSVGLGYSLVVATAALAHPHNVKLVPIEDFHPQRDWELLMAWPLDHLSGAAATFVSVAKEALIANPEWLDETAPVTAT